MNANELYEKICKKKAKKRPQIETKLHQEIAEILKEESEVDLSRGTEMKENRLLPMSIFIQPII